MAQKYRGEGVHSREEFEKGAEKKKGVREGTKTRHRSSRSRSVARGKNHE